MSALYEKLKDNPNLKVYSPTFGHSIEIEFIDHDLYPIKVYFDKMPEFGRKFSPKGEHIVHNPNELYDIVIDYSDKALLAEQYTPVEEPYYPGDGNLSVNELQKLCNQYKEYTHQQAVIKQNIIKLLN